MALDRRKAQQPFCWVPGNISTLPHIVSCSSDVWRWWTYTCSINSRSFSFETCESKCMSNFLILDWNSAGFMSLGYGKKKAEITFITTEYEKMTALSLFTSVFSHSFLSQFFIFHLSWLTRAPIWLSLKFLIKLKLLTPQIWFTSVTD